MKEDNGNEVVVDIKADNNKNASVTNVLIAVVAILVIMSAVQVFQTQQLLAAVQSGAIKASSQTQGSSVNLPSQVGGCG